MEDINAGVLNQTRDKRKRDTFFETDFWVKTIEKNTSKDNKRQQKNGANFF
jgi:hypothetical protein